MKILSLIGFLCVAATQACSASDKELKALSALPSPELHAKSEKGDAKAQFLLGERNRTGTDVEKDEKEAVKLWRKAAMQGSADAQVVLGAFYYNGRGVVKDEAEAYKWILLAAARGDEVAKSWMVLLDKELTEAQRKEGEKRAKAWQAQFDAKRKANAKGKE